MAKRVRLDLEGPIAPQMAEAGAIVRGGGLLIYPTDTFYGIGVDPFQSAAVDRIFVVKGRAPNKPILVLVAALEEAQRCADLEVEYFDRLTEAFWPGPLTLVLPGSPRLPSNVTAGTGKIGIRLPGSQVAREIVGGCGGVLTGTSANLSGDKDPREIRTIADSVARVADLIIDVGVSPSRVPSTLLDLTGLSPRILRRGAIPLSEIEKALGFKITDGAAEASLI